MATANLSRTEPGSVNYYHVGRAQRGIACKGGYQLQRFIRDPLLRHYNIYELIISGFVREGVVAKRSSIGIVLRTLHLYPHQYPVHREFR
jgi:hypothetical protein